jgi:nicotinamide mononucleotide transporter
MKKLIKQELSGWKAWEITWMAIACAVIIGFSIYWGDTLMGIISATTGVICVIATGKGKLMAYLFGAINCALYAIISYQAKYYGETMLNAIYYLPMQFVGFVVWKKNMNVETGEVKKRHMSWKLRLLSLAAIAVTTWLYGLLLAHLGGNMPYIDSFTTMCSVIAMIVSIGMYSEQWWIWVGVNVFTIVLWTKDFMTGNDNMATLLMWCVYLVNSVIMLIKWEKEARNSKEAQTHEV